MLPGLFRRHRPRTRAEIKELFKPENNVIPMSDWWTYVRPPSPEPEPLIQLPLTKENIEKHNSGKMVIQIMHKIGKGPGKTRRIYWMRYRKKSLPPRSSKSGSTTIPFGHESIEERSRGSTTIPFGHESIEERSSIAWSFECWWSHVGINIVEFVRWIKWLCPGFCISSARSDSASVVTFFVQWQNGAITLCVHLPYRYRHHYSFCTFFFSSFW